MTPAEPEGRGLLRSTVLRFTVAYLLLFALSAALLLAWLYWSVTAYLEQQSEDVIAAEVQGLAEQYRARGLSGLVGVLRERSGERGDPEAVYLLTDPRLLPIAGNLAQWPVGAEVRDDWIDFARVREPLGAVPVRARVFLLGGGFRLLVGREFLKLARTERLIRRAFAWALLGAVALGGIGGIVFTRAVARRIERVNLTARRIREGDLSQRVPRDGSADEFDRLAEELNAMLARIQALMDGVRHVGDSLAHDMRLPLTRVRNRLEALREALPDDAPAQAEVQACVADADQMLATFAALLRIARLEAGGAGAPAASVDLAGVVEDALDLYRAPGEEAGIAFEAELNPATVAGDRDLLFQMVANLLDNALKFAPPGSSVQVRTQCLAGKSRLLVSDRGPGVPAAERERVFDRFYRVERSRHAPGSGLGLALVKAVVEHHRGTIRLEDATPGLRVVAELPAADSRTP
ncbi:MAG: HAMP domain-containing histidine kinase [Xanthomonadales bacterium]|nr:HAMP domain-containing histidine kinase [Xanthomonadales bacterium]